MCRDSRCYKKRQISRLASGGTNLTWCICNDGCCKETLPEIVPKGTVPATEVSKAAENLPECEIAAVMKKDDAQNSAVNEDTHKAQTSPAASVMMDVVVKKDALPEIVPKGTVPATEVGKAAA